MAHVEEFSNRPAFKHVDKERVLTFLREKGTHNVLDIGCGVGNTVASLAELGFEAFGVTINPDEIVASEIPERLSRRYWGRSFVHRATLRPENMTCH
jgi:cyclopropane fatty-acyl-phospholipid synthase-like methyltransferase